MSAGATRGRLLRSNANALLFLACVAIWSTNWIAITTQVRATPVVTALFWRFLLAYLTLRAAERWRGAAAPVDAAARLPMVVVGVTYYFGGIGLTYVATRDLSSAAIACLSTSVIFISMAIKRAVFGTPVSRGALGGALVCALGLALFLGADAGMAEVPAAGLLAAAAAFTLVAIGSVASERVQKRHAVTSLRLNRTAAGWACVLYLLTALATGSSLAVPAEAGFLLPLLYLGVVCSALVFVLYLALIARVGAEYASYVTFIYPLGAAYVSSALGESALSGAMVAGSALVAAGCLVALKFERFAAKFKRGAPP